MNLSSTELTDSREEECNMNDGFEKYLPTYLKNDIDALVEGLQTKSTLLDCLWCEVYGSINSAFYDYAITAEEAAYLREKYLGLEVETP